MPKKAPKFVTPITGIPRIFYKFLAFSPWHGGRSATGRVCAGLLAVTLVGAACTSTTDSAVSPTPDTESSAPEATTDSSRAGIEDSRATSVLPSSPGLTIEIDRVSDGDSVRASSDEGELEIRLIGINAPESNECFGDQSQEILQQLLDVDSVQIHPWPPELDDFGRELGFLVADGLFVNLALIEQGAVVARAQSDHDFIGDFETAEATASDAGIGLWARDACGAPTEANLEIVDWVADAPGNDQENPNGEWIEIANSGENPADLAGWTLRDESTRHRYEFPDVALPPGQRVRIFTGCGTNQVDGDPGELYWCSPEPPVWNNGGDTAFLLDTNGSIVDDEAVGG